MADGQSGRGEASQSIVLGGREGDDARLLVEMSPDEMIAKARGASTDVTATNKLPLPDEEANRLTRAGALVPYYDPSWLTLLVETSSVLGTAFRALQSNVDGHGFTLKPRLDFDDPKIREVVADAITLERIEGAGFRNPTLDVGALIPSDVEVDLKIAELKTRLRLERARAEAFLSACAPGIGRGFTWLRKELRRDRLSTGNCFLGVKRNNRDEPAEFEYLPAVQMRLRPIVRDVYGRPTTVEIDVPVRRTPIAVEMRTTHYSFRTFVQLGLTREVYFKEYGDHRTFSADDGREYPSVEELPRGHREATEVIHLKDSSGVSEYGVPLWIGATPPVTGYRASQEVNAQHFDSNGIPRMMVIVSGGTLKPGADKVLADNFRAHSKGRKNYGALMIIEATPPDGAAPGARVTIEVKPLKEAIPDDGLFLKYGSASRDEILSQFRLPKFVIGMLDDVNKSSSEEGREFVESEVYQPMRAEFDAVMDSFLESIGVYGWRFVSNSPINRDPATMIDMVKKAAEAGGATIDDVREIMGDVFNRRFPATADDLEFGKYPIALATLKLQQAIQAMGAGPLASAPTLSTTIGSDGRHADGRDRHAADAPAAKARPIAKSQAEMVRYLEGLRDAFDASAADAHAFEVATAEGDVLVLPMSAAQMADLVEPG